MDTQIYLWRSIINYGAPWSWVSSPLAIHNPASLGRMFRFIWTRWYVCKWDAIGLKLMACHWFGNMPLSEHHIIYLGSWLRKNHSSQIQMFELNMSLTYARDLCLVCSVTTLSVWWIHIILALVTQPHVSVKWMISDSDVINPMSTCH